MTNLRFAKLSGAGNDFVLVDSRRLPRGRSLAALARRLCDRREGVGADGLLVVRRERPPFAHRLEYRNADGSSAFCGNGTRCAIWWMRRAGWIGNACRVHTALGPLEARVTGRERARVRMPDAGSLRGPLALDAAGRRWRVWAVDTGAPHALVRVSAGALGAFPVAEVGRALRRHPAFGRAGTNADFVAVSGRRSRLRTYERGVEGETLACGTGAVAAAIALSAWTGLKPPWRVRVASGAALAAGFRREGEGFTEVWLEGPARVVYEGEVRL